MKHACVVMIGWLLAVGCSGNPRDDARGAPVGADRRVAADDNTLAARALSAGERKTLDAVGFAILGSGEAKSFHLGYTALFHAHQPVYVTADSLLHAWHSSYDAIVRQLELASLVPALDAMIGDLRRALAGRRGPPGPRADVDTYLTVAASLLHGKLEAPVAGGDPAAIAALVEHATAARGLELALFGTTAKFDFSMLQPRGHYTSDDALKSYFRAMAWLGRVELRLARREAPDQPWQIDHRVLDAAQLLARLFDPAARKAWDTIDQTLAALVGPNDSMSLPAFIAARAQLPAELGRTPDAEVAAAFTGPAAQRIRTQLAFRGEASIAFVLLGPRYVFDADVLSNLVADSLDTDPARLMPSPLDVGYAVLGNPAARRQLAGELEIYGAPYAAALEAAHHDAVAGDRALGSGSLYHRWLGALRELSPDPARDAGLPAPLASDAWSRRMLATQLASWAELRHDNLLYAKQSDSIMEFCEYPDGYVDPYPGFYAAMAAIAQHGKALVAALATPAQPIDGLGAYFDGMAATMEQLRQIAVRERADQPLTAADLEFLNHMVSIDGKSAGCTTVFVARGWYGDLYFDRDLALHHEPVIADVHTQPTSAGGDLIGHVLHVATGMPRMMVVSLAHDLGKHTQRYRGFVSSYAEVVTENFRRLTDEDWGEMLANQPPAPPGWLADLVAP